MLLKTLVLLVAIYFNSSLAELLGIKNLFSFALTPLLVIVLVRMILNRINYFSVANRDARNLFYVGALVLIFKAITLAHQDDLRLCIQLLIVPAFVTIYLNSEKSRLNLILKQLLTSFYVIECGIAIFERFFLINLFELENTINFDQDWSFRSRALMGDPLNNAMVVTTILTFIICSNNIKFSLKFFYLLLGYFALFSFNARGAILVTTILILPFFFLEVHKNIINHKKIIILSQFLFLAFLFFWIRNSSLGGRLVHNEKLVDGSAQTRLDVFNFVNIIDNYDLLFGNSEQIVLVQEKLESAGIENGIIAMILVLGLVFTLPVLLMLLRMQNSLLLNFKKKQKLLILVAFYLIGIMNPNLIHPEQWLVFIFSSYAYANS